MSLQITAVLAHLVSPYLALCLIYYAVCPLSQHFFLSLQVQAGSSCLNFAHQSYVCCVISLLAYHNINRAFTLAKESTKNNWSRTASNFYFLKGYMSDWVTILAWQNGNCRQTQSGMCCSSQVDLVLPCIHCKATKQCFFPDSNSPNWCSYISLKNYSRGFDKRSEHSPSGPSCSKADKR